MKNPFVLSDEKLKNLLHKYSSWRDADEREKAYPDKERKKVEEVQGTLLNKTYLTGVSNKELAEKIFDYSRKLEGPAFIRLGVERIGARTPDIKNILLYLLDSPDDPFEKTENILSGKYKIPIFAKAFWTPIFQARYPQNLPNWNNKTETCLKELGVSLKRLSTQDKYKAISEAFLYLQMLDPAQNFYTLNHLMHFGTAIEEGRDLIKELKQIDSHICLIGTAGNMEDVEEEQAFLQQHGASASWWSFPIKDNALKLLKPPFQLYINAGKGLFPYRYTVSEYKTSKGNRGIISPWPDFTLKKFREKRKAGNKKSEIFKTWFKVTAIEKINPPLRIDDFKPIEGLSDKRSILNQTTFGYAYNPPLQQDPDAYTLKTALSDLFIDEQTLKQIMDGLLYKKNIILQGPPGTGKTFMARRLAYVILEKKDQERVETIQFHQSYAYEDFVQGYRPTDAGGFELKNGVFYEFVKKAIQDKEHKYFLIIDEINRANLSKVLGELMMLIECDKRGKEFALKLTYSKDGDKFYVPENLYLIGTMNTADRSITIVDYALRRRFLFFSLKTELGEKFRRYLQNMNVDQDVIDTIIDRISKLNTIIAEDTKQLGPGFEIGHSYFCPSENVTDSKAWYNRVIDLEIRPLLVEYWFDDRERAEEMAAGLYI